jgi:hypothetical protein
LVGTIGVSEAISFVFRLPDEATRVLASEAVIEGQAEINSFGEGAQARWQELHKSLYASDSIFQKDTLKTFWSAWVRAEFDEAAAEADAVEDPVDRIDAQLAVWTIGTWRGEPVDSEMGGFIIRPVPIEGEIERLTQLLDDVDDVVPDRQSFVVQIAERLEDESLTLTWLQKHQEGPLADEFLSAKVRKLVDFGVLSQFSAPSRFSAGHALC